MFVDIMLIAMMVLSILLNLTAVLSRPQAAFDWTDFWITASLATSIAAFLGAYIFRKDRKWR